VSHVDVREPSYKGSLTGGVKSLFCLHAAGVPPPRLVLAGAAIDVLSVAAIESLREDTLYSATGGGMGTIAALETLLGHLAMLPAHSSVAPGTRMGQGTASRSGITRLPNNLPFRLSGFGLRSKAATGMTFSTPDPNWKNRGGEASREVQGFS